MPTISMFYGIIILQCSMALLYECIMPQVNTHPPHFHVYYGEYRASVDIQTCEITQGKLPKKQSRLVIAWAVFRIDAGRTQKEEPFYLV